MDLASIGQFVPHADGMHRPGTDDRMIVLFSRRAVQNEWKSRETGKPVFESADFVRIQQPGERDYVERPVRDDDRVRWPRQWAAYESQQQQAPDGTPLDLMFPAEPHIPATLKQIQILTVEHLAGASEAAISRMGMGARSWVTRAKAYLETAERGAAFHQMERQLEDKDERIKTLEAQVAQILAARERDEDERPRRGRKPEAA